MVSPVLAFKIRHALHVLAWHPTLVKRAAVKECSLGCRQGSPSGVHAAARTEAEEEAATPWGPYAYASEAWNQLHYACGRALALRANAAKPPPLVK